MSTEPNMSEWLRRTSPQAAVALAERATVVPSGERRSAVEAASTAGEPQASSIE